MLVVETEEYKEKAAEVKEEAKKYNAGINFLFGLGLLVPIILIILFFKFVL